MEFDLHIHSRFSFDSEAEPEEIVEHAVKAGLRGIAITDHNEVGAAEIAAAHAGERLIVIPGIEVTTEFGDVLGYFIEEKIETDEEDPEKELRAVTGLIREKGGLAGLAHPSRQALAEIEENDLTELFDLIEGFNARRHTLKNVLEFGGEPYILDFAERHNLGLVAGSDAHSPGAIGGGRTIIPADTIEDVKLALEKKTTVLTGRKTGWMTDLLDMFKSGHTEGPEGEDW